jgi:hypothetical protein
MHAEDEQQRLAGALTLLQITRTSAGRFEPANTAILLPRVLRARHDPSEPVATAAVETWADLGVATAAVLRTNGAVPSSFSVLLLMILWRHSWPGC